MKALILFLTFTSVIAAVPTAEGLFRNSINPDIEDNLVVFTLKATVEENKPQIETGLILSSDEPKTETLKSSFFYKYLFDNSNQKLDKVILSKYSDSEMRIPDLLDLKVKRDIKTTETETVNFEKRLIDGLVTMYSMNSSKIMSNLFKGISPDFLTNKEVLNNDKKELLQQYKEYLVKKNAYDEKIKNLKKSGAIQSDTELSDEEAPVSPLISEETDEKERIQGIISQSMYKKPENIKLVRDGKDFFWEINYQNVWARFTNENHELKHLKIKKDGIEIEVVPHEFVTYGGRYRVPKEIEILYPEKKITLTITNMYSLKSKNKTFEQRIEEYRKVHEKVKEAKKKTATTEVIGEPVENTEPKFNISDYIL